MSKDVILYQKQAKQLAKAVVKAQHAFGALNKVLMAVGIDTAAAVAKAPKKAKAEKTEKTEKKPASKGNGSSNVFAEM